MIKSIHTRRDALRESGDIKADDGRKKIFFNIYAFPTDNSFKNALCLVLYKSKEPTSDTEHITRRTENHFLH